MIRYPSRWAASRIVEYTLIALAAAGFVLALIR